MVKSALVFGHGKSTLIGHMLNSDYKFYDTPCLELYHTPSTAVLIVSQELESSIIQEYTILARCIGIKNLVVCVDKIQWGDLEKKIKERISYNPIFIPVSIILGEGLTSRTKEYPNVPCLLELIKEEEIENTKHETITCKNIKISVKIFSPTLISSGWKGICHLANNITRPIVVEKVYTKEGKEICTVNDKECLLDIEFDIPLEVIKNSRVIIRNGDITIAGGIINI